MPSNLRQEGAMRSRRILTIGSILLFSLVLLAQEAQLRNPCIAAGETIYELADGVNPPQPKPENNTKGPKIRGSMSLELVVNGEGNVCRVTILATSNRNSAQQVAEFISQHWSFKPATKKGRRVAVKFRMNFTPS
ncbi:MAG: TonB family protein [Acidobacteriaceae bacterium]